MLLSFRQNPAQPASPRTNLVPNLAAARALLTSSPLPSPGLPSLLPRHGQRPRRLNSRSFIRIAAWLTTFTTLFWIVGRIVHADQIRGAVNYLSSEGKAFQIKDGILPENATPIVVSDQRGRSKWTVSIPPGLEFPLKPETYVDICTSSQEISHRLASQKKEYPGAESVVKNPHTYYRTDPHYMDIGDAEAHSILPGLSRSSPLTFADESMELCERSLTYALESSTAGLGQTLLSLWLAYGLAVHEKRAFFIDSTRWPYGNYLTYFKPPPTPDCARPPRTQITPCPHQARHLLISAATRPYALGHMFVHAFEDGHKQGVMRQETIFGILRTGYEALFRGKLNDEDQAYFEERTKTLDEEVRGKGGMTIGVHVRHGDRHPFEYQYQKSYIPLETYIETAQNLSLASSSPSSSQILVASDDPTIYNSPLFDPRTPDSSTTDPKISRAQSDIDFPSPLDDPSQEITDTPLWTGGFFPAIFWSLGLPANERIPYKPGSPVSSRQPEEPVEYGDPSLPQILPSPPSSSGEEPSDPHKHPNPEALAQRTLVARSYFLDLAVVGASDRVVCAVSASGCRILAVMLGWQRGIVEEGWRNVDGDFEWRGVDW